MTLLTFLLAASCNKGKDKDGDGGDDTDSVPFDCAELGAEAEPTPPDLATDAWEERGDHPPATRLFTMVEAAGTGSIFVGSDVAGTWRSQDGAQTWLPMSTGITHNLAELYAPPAGDGEVYRSNGGPLQKSDDDGGTWVEIAFPLDTDRLVLAIGGPADDADTLYVFTSDGVMHLSSDAGENFVELGDTQLGPSDDGHLHLKASGYRVLGEAGDAPAILATPTSIQVIEEGFAGAEESLTDELATFTLVRDPADPLRLVIANHEGQLFRSTDGGRTWTEGAAIDGHPETAAWSDEGRLYVPVEDALLVSEDAGESFVSIETGISEPTSVVVASSGRIVLADQEGMQWSDDFGETFVDANEPPRDTGMAVTSAHPICPSVIVTASQCSGGLFSSTEWGESWEPAALHMHYVMAAHWDPTDPARLWAVSDDALYRWDADLSWYIAHQDVHFHGFTVDPRDGDHLLIGSVGSGEYADDSGRVYVSTDGAETWSESSAGLPTTEASMHTLIHWPDDPDIVLLGTYRGGDVAHLSGEGIGLWRSTDNGTSWSKTDLPQQEIAWLTESPSGVVAATDDGLWESTDKGVTWAKVDGPTGWLVGADFQGERGMAIDRIGETWKTYDGGESWDQLPSPDRPEEAFNYLGAISISADGSTAWAASYPQGVWRIGL